MNTKLPTPSPSEVTRALLKNETLSFRLTTDEKDGIRAAAASVGMPISVYLVKCHELVARQLRSQ